MTTQLEVEDRRRPATQESHLKGVETALALMRKSFHESLTLDDLADSAHMSAYHFSRVFKRCTRLSPMQFLAAIRIAAAKRALLQTTRSVTDVCWDVGYESLGSFSSNFTEMVGFSPREWRSQLVALTPAIAEGCDRLLAVPWPQSGETDLLHCRITNPADDVFVCAGVFAKPIPFGQPTDCVFGMGASHFTIGSISTESQFILALGFTSLELRSHLAEEICGRWVSSARLPHPRTSPTPDIELRLRRSSVTDPPVLSALPLFLLGKLGLNLK